MTTTYETGGDGDEGTADADAFARARDAVAALRGQGRGPDGRVLPGNTIALKTGERSTRLWSEPEVAAWHRERVAELRADVGADVSQVKGALLESFARVELIEASLGENVFTHGPLTGKGRTRAALTALLGVVAQKTRLAQLIGLDRGVRQVPSVADYLAGKADAS